MAVQRHPVQSRTGCGFPILDLLPNPPASLGSWSLGVVLGELLCGLPKRKKKHGKDGLLWCQAIQDRVGNHPDEAQDDLTTFLLQNMLSLEPEGRSSAQECHGKALRLSEGTYDTWKSFQAINPVEESTDESDDESEPESEQETIRGKVEGSGTAGPPVHHKDRGTASATADSGVISSNELLVQEFEVYFDRSDTLPPPSVLPSSSRIDTKEMLDRLQDPEDPLFHASQIGDDDHLPETDKSTLASLHDDSQCVDTPPPGPASTEPGPVVADPTPSSKRTREWEAEVASLLQADLYADELSEVDVNRGGHIAKRARQHDSPTVVSSLESSA